MLLSAYVIPREGVESLILLLCSNTRTVSVIPREGVESCGEDGMLRPADRMGVIPREGVESLVNVIEAALLAKEL